MSTDNIKKLPDRIDAYAQAREERLALQREVNNLQERENMLKNGIIQILQENELSTAGSANYSVKLAVDDKPVAGNWQEIYDYIKENDAFDLLQRRLGEAAVKSRWEDGITIPGVTTFPVEKLTLSKVS